VLSDQDDCALSKYNHPLSGNFSRAAAGLGHITQERLIIA
jgi:hypothetical protein